MPLLIQSGSLLDHFIFRNHTDVGEVMNPASIIERYVSAPMAPLPDRAEDSVNYGGVLDVGC